MAPLLCAVHCAAAPLLVLVAPAVVENPAVEFGLLAATVILAGVALSLGVGRHRNAAPVLPVGVGILAWWASLSHVFHPVPEELTTSLAALVVAGGLLWNARLQCLTADPSGPTCSSCEATEHGPLAGERAGSGERRSRDTLPVADIEPSPALRP